jgi:hypothetical protein
MPHCAEAFTMVDDYVRFDEYEDALVSLELIAHVAPLVREKPQHWKWMIVGAHSALQGAMVCALADSTGTSILTEKSATEMLRWLDADPATRGQCPKERLADFGELLKRCIARSGLLELTPEQRKDIGRLHDHFRNNLVHFTPKGWSIEKAGLPRIVGATIDAAEVLMRHVIGRMAEDQQQRLTDALATVRSHLPAKLPGNGLAQQSR